MLLVNYFSEVFSLRTSVLFPITLQFLMIGLIVLEAFVLESTSQCLITEKL